MSLNFEHILTLTLTLFAVIDILGSIPVIISMRQRLGHIQSEKATIAAGIIMIIFLFLGKEILNLVGIEVQDFALAGAIVIFILAMELILDREIIKTGQDSGTGSIVPIAFPLVAGAGTLTTLISLRADYAIEEISIAIALNLVFVYLILKTTKRIEHLLGQGGINILRRVFGIILLAIGIKLFRSNIVEFTESVHASLYWLIPQG